MNLDAIQKGLARELVGARAERAYDTARTRRAALRPHASIRAALDAVANIADQDHDGKDAILVAFVAEYRFTEDRLWTSALTTAFLPLLKRLYRRAVRALQEDTHQALFTALLEAIASLPRREGYTALNVRREVERNVLRAVWGERTHEMFAEAVRVNTVKGVVHSLGAEAQRWESLLTAARRRLGDDFDLVVGITVRDECLRDYVARLLPSADERTRGRAYEAIKRRRSRARSRLRAELGAAA